MKISISLSERAAGLLENFVKGGNSNPSVVCEAAISALAGLPEDRRSRLLRETMALKRPQTPTSWRTLFWTALAEEFETKDMAGDEQRYLFAARPYRGFQVIFDAQPDLRGDSHEIIVFTDTAPPYNERTRRIGMTWTFGVEESVFDSARTVAAWIRENEASLAA